MIMFLFTSSQRQVKSLYTYVQFSGNHPTDCSELPTGSVSGVYTVETNKSHPYKVFCDMDTDGGGWTVRSANRISTRS